MTNEEQPLPETFEAVKHSYLGKMMENGATLEEIQQASDNLDRNAPIGELSGVNADGENVYNLLLTEQEIQYICVALITQASAALNSQDEKIKGEMGLSLAYNFSMLATRIDYGTLIKQTPNFHAALNNVSGEIVIRRALSALGLDGLGL